MVDVVTINRPDVVAAIEEAANRLTNGDKTEAVALAMRTLLEKSASVAPLSGAHAGGVRARYGVDQTAPVLEDKPDAATGAEMTR